jgi:hypothetical protein
VKKENPIWQTVSQAQAQKTQDYGHKVGEAMAKIWSPEVNNAPVVPEKIEQLPTASQVQPQQQTARKVLQPNTPEII